MKGECFSQCIFFDLKITFHHSRTCYNGVIDEYEANEVCRPKSTLLVNLNQLRVNKKQLEER